MRHLLLALLLVPMLLAGPQAGAAEDAAEPPEPAGMWRGQLDPPEGLRAKPLQLVLHIRHGQQAAALSHLANTSYRLGKAMKNEEKNIATISSNTRRDFSCDGRAASVIFLLFVSQAKYKG